MKIDRKKLINTELNNWKIIHFFDSPYWIKNKYYTVLWVEIKCCLCNYKDNAQFSTFKKLGRKCKKCNKNKYNSYNGLKFNHWTIIKCSRVCKYVGQNGKITSVPRAIVQCDCGIKKEINLYSITSGKSKQCHRCHIKFCSEIFHKLSPPLFKEANGRWKGIGPIPGRLIGQFINGAKVRGIEYTISNEYLLELWNKQNGKCALTGLELIIPKSKNIGIELPIRARFASLDRIDSKKGYIVDNVWWVCSMVNFMKQEYPLELFLKYCELIVIKEGKVDES
jgi:hypothetical protein